MSDVLSVDSGPESEYDFSELNDDNGGGTQGTAIRKRLGGNLSS